MQLKPIRIDLKDYPPVFHPFLNNAKIFDSSCSREARVIFIEKGGPAAGGGLFLKSADKGALAQEAVMTEYFHSKGLGACVVKYLSADKDYLLTQKIRGDDCIAPKYLENPARLCDKIAEILHNLHKLDFKDCPAVKTFKTDASEAKALESNALLHGDYCLPNIILDDWEFSGFVDLDQAGAGDRHIDIFWGIWTLQYNLKTDKYRQRFIDAYGRAEIDLEKIEIVYEIEKKIGL